MIVCLFNRWDIEFSDMGDTDPPLRLPVVRATIAVSSRPKGPWALNDNDRDKKLNVYVMLSQRHNVISTNTATLFAWTNGTRNFHVKAR